MMKRVKDKKTHLIPAAEASGGFNSNDQDYRLLTLMHYLFSKTLLNNIIISILCLSTIVFAQESPALKIFPPANGEIRLENHFGDIEVAVWQES